MRKNRESPKYSAGDRAILSCREGEARVDTTVEVVELDSPGAYRLGADGRQQWHPPTYRVREMASGETCAASERDLRPPPVVYAGR